MVRRHLPPGLGVPIANDLTNDSVIDRYTHTNGDLFLSGTLNGRLTIGTGNDIIVTNDIRYANTSTASDDLLGLIPQNSVKISTQLTATHRPTFPTTGEMATRRSMPRF